MSNVEIVCNNLPVRGSNEAAGYDFIYSGDDLIIEPQNTTLVNLNVKMALPKGMVLFLKTRSSFAKMGILTTGGVIDSDYRGCISACLLNTSSAPFLIKSGMKICQGVLLKYNEINFIQVKQLSDTTERGEQGFGSSGIFNVKE